jgi:Predicted regulator of amino acid metabolism, contains ACT domain
MVAIMLLILEEYFKDHPIKRKVVEGVFNRGISIRDGKFYVDGIEVSISEVAKTLGVNRRTVYDTIKIIESKPEIKELMGRLRPIPDMGSIAPLMGHQTVILRIAPGYFGTVLPEFLSTVKKYGCYLKEIEGRNFEKEDIYIRAIIYHTVPPRTFAALSEIDGVRKVTVETSEDLDPEPICSKCEVKGLHKPSFPPVCLLMKLRNEFFPGDCSGLKPLNHYSQCLYTIFNNCFRG